MSDEARFGRLRDRLGELHGRSRALARQLGDVDLGELRGPADLALIPVLRKSAIAALQAAEPPFGGLAAAPTTRSPACSPRPAEFTSPNPSADDPWGAAKALAAAGVEAGEIVVNCFSYHLTPGGRILESGALALGCPVIPAGPGNTEQLIAAIAHLKPSVYCGPPDFLKIVLDKARGRRRRRFVTEEGAGLRRRAAADACAPSSRAPASRRARPTPPPTSGSSPTRPTTPTARLCPACWSTTTSSSRSSRRAPNEPAARGQGRRGCRDEACRRLSAACASRPAISPPGPRPAGSRAGWGAPTSRPRSRACSSTRARSSRSESAIPSSERCGSS